MAADGGRRGGEANGEEDTCNEDDSEEMKGYDFDTMLVRTTLESLYLRWGA